MSAEQNKQLSHPFTEEVDTHGNLAAGVERYSASQQETVERAIFGLALALAAEPSRLGQLRQMLANLLEQGAIPEGFSTWAIRRIDERVTSMALEYAHNAEAILQILSFKSGSFNSLAQDIEDLYQHAQITQRVYVSARLLLREAHKI